MKRNSLAIILLTFFFNGISVYADLRENINDTLLVYNCDPKGGLQAALKDSTGKWQPVGQLFSSDYAAWGSGKNMFAPFIFTIEDSTCYVAVFQVDDKSPCFAVAWSEDLIVWRPQDYPKMSTKGCLMPVIRAENDGYAVLFKTPQGNFRKAFADKTFRHFSQDVESCQEEYDQVEKQIDSITIQNVQFYGQKIALKEGQKDYISNYFEALHKTNEANGRKLTDFVLTKDMAQKQPIEAELTIEGRDQKDISDMLVGVFFEDISYAADGGLYAEMIQNRDFEYTSQDRSEWNSTTAWRQSNGNINIFDGTQQGAIPPLSVTNPHYAIIESDSLINQGWDGIPLKRGETYNFSIYINNIYGKKSKLNVALVAENKTLSQATITVNGAQGEWKKYEVEIKSEYDATATLALVPQKKCKIAVDMISLFPQDTYNGRKNGLRKDLAQTIANLHPKFIRFPGGCLSHGEGLENMYRWKETIGKLEDRTPAKNIWRYHQTRGLGFYEYFLFCEDINAEPLPVLPAGVPCQNSSANNEGFGGQQGGVNMEEMGDYIQDILDLIEWANGDASTNKWAKMRSDAGHPEPFNLKYIGIGNEDLISTVFEERCSLICKAIKEHYPDIIICGTVGPFHYPSSDYIEGWKFANENRDIIDMVDEHYYENTGWFINNQHYYDNYDRSSAKVYLGEYAAREGMGNIACALAEAVHLCNIERNADVVAMTSYAPLLSKDKHSNWHPDLIYFDNNKIRTAPSYETQRLFSTYSGNTYITSTIACDSLFSDRIVASVVRDKAGQAYLKVVNILPEEINLKVKTNGLHIANVVRYEGFGGNPKQESVEVESGSLRLSPDKTLNVTLPPYSFRVIML